MTVEMEMKTEGQSPKKPLSKDPSRVWLDQQLQAEFLVRSPQVAVLYIVLGASILTEVVAVPHAHSLILSVAGWLLLVGSLIRLGILWFIRRDQSRRSGLLNAHALTALLLAMGLGAVNGLVIWTAAVYGDAPFWAAFMMAALSLGALTSSTPVWRIFLAFQVISLLIPGLVCVALWTFTDPFSQIVFPLPVATAIFGGFLYVVLQGRVIHWGHQRRFQMEWDLNRERDQLRQALGELEEAHQLLESEQRKTIASSKFIALGEMASGIAHEINNPLAIIKGHVALLEKMSSSDSTVKQEKVMKASNAITRSVERIASIIQALRLFARDGTKDEKTETRLHELIHQSVQLFSDRLKKNSVKLELHYEADITLNCRAAQMSQVLHSLLSNALRAIEPFEKKEIVVEVKKPEDNMVLVLIRDSGSGVAPELRERIFEPFFSRFGGEMGRGLGLSVARGIIEEHGGTIQVSEEHASQFEIRLPA